MLLKLEREKVMKRMKKKLYDKCCQRNKGKMSIDAKSKKKKEKRISRGRNRDNSRHH